MKVEGKVGGNEFGKGEEKIVDRDLDQRPFHMCVCMRVYICKYNYKRTNNVQNISHNTGMLCQSINDCTVRTKQQILLKY